MSSTGVSSFDFNFDFDYDFAIDATQTFDDWLGTWTSEGTSPSETSSQDIFHGDFAAAGVIDPALLAAPTQTSLLPPPPPPSSSYTTTTTTTEADPDLELELALELALAPSRSPSPAPLAAPVTAPEAKTTTKTKQRYICLLCPKTFSRLFDRDRHMKLHGNVKEFACTSCSATFSQQSNLKQHIDGKHQTTLRLCGYAGCNASYKYASQLSLHRKKAGHRVVPERKLNGVPLIILDE